MQDKFLGFVVNISAFLHTSLHFLLLKTSMDQNVDQLQIVVAIVSVSYFQVEWKISNSRLSKDLKIIKLLQNKANFYYKLGTHLILAVPKLIKVRLLYPLPLLKGHLFPTSIGSVYFFVKSTFKDIWDLPTVWRC